MDNAQLDGRGHLLDLRECPAAERNTHVEAIKLQIREDRKNGERKDSGEPDFKWLAGIVHDWIGIAEIGREYTNEKGGNWIFRGQSFPHIPLPKIGRPGIQKDAKTGNPIKQMWVERWILDQFKLRARPHIRFDPKDDLEWMAVAQHHGMYTRLLDWTESFLVAVFFAVMNAGVEGPATIYAMPRPRRIRSAKAIGRLRSLQLYQSSDISARITAQRGLFTVTSKPDTPHVSPRLEQWIIPDLKVCFNIKKQLHLCGINESVLYPDVDGLARYLSWRFKWPNSIIPD